MDSEERHEPKENELAEFFQNFGEWWSRHGNVVLIAIIILAGGVTVYNIYTSRAAQRHEQAWVDLAVATTPEGYAQVAEAHDDPAVQSLAYLRGADLYRRRALGRYEPTAEMTAAVSDLDGESMLDGAGTDSDDAPQPDPAEDLAQAAAMYQRVLEQDEAEVPTVYRLNALLGLGAVAESEKRWDDASGHYEQAIELAGDQLPQLAAQARERRDLLDELRRPIVFASEAIAPASQTPDSATGAEGGGLPGLDLNIPTNTAGSDANPSQDAAETASDATNGDETTADDDAARNNGEGEGSADANRNTADGAADTP